MSRRRAPSASPARVAPPAAPSSFPAPWLAAALLAGAVLLAYANVLSAPFIFDDQTAITDNASIRHLWPPGPVFAPPGGAGGAAARPLVNFSLALNYALGGERVEGYHALNLLIHLAASLALFGLVRRTLALPRLRDRWGAAALPLAFFTALLWAVHPLLTESVSCIIQRTESLVGLWYLLMFYCLVRAAESAAPRRWLAGSLAACLLGMLTKEVMAAAPLLAGLFHVVVVDGSWRAAWARRGKFFGLLALCWGPLAILVVLNPGRHGAAGFGLGVVWWEYALTQCQAIGRYLALAFWPHPLVLDYGDPLVRHPGEVGPQALLLAGLLAATGWAWHRKMPAAFAGLWFFAILAPSSSVLPLVTQTIAEHRMYLPLAAVIVLAVTGAYALAGRRSYAVFLLLAVVLLGATVRRNATYRTALGLWSDTVAQAPANARAHNNLGNTLEDAGRDDEARREYTRALELKPGYAMAHYNLANLLARHNELPDAITHYQESLRLAPDSPDTHNNLGNVFVLQARWADAQAEFNAALALNPDDAVAHCNLGNALVTLGRPAEAVPHYEAALRVVPDQTFHYNLACALAALGRTEEALAHFQTVVQLAPGRADAHCRLGLLLAAAGRRAQAIAELEEALRLQPDYAEARQQLARLGAPAPPR